jgi:hypothetical protein
MKNDSTTPATITTLPDGALAITVGAWSLRAETAEDEARVRDVDLAERLGYERPRTIRGLIARLESDGKLKDLHRAPRRSAGLMRGPAATEIVVEEYWLTEAQALKVVSKSETDKADALLDEVIAVYMAVRRGMVPRAAPQPEASPLLAQFVETLQAMQGQIETLSAEVATLRAAGQGRTCLGNGAHGSTSSTRSSRSRPSTRARSARPIARPLAECRNSQMTPCASGSPIPATVGRRGPCSRRCASGISTARWSACFTTRGSGQTSPLPGQRSCGLWRTRTARSRRAECCEPHSHISAGNPALRRSCGRASARSSIS